MKGNSTMTKPQPSNEAIEATIHAICLFWAKQLNGDFHPDASAFDCHLRPGLADRFEEDMQYVWAYADDPHASAVRARLTAYPQLHDIFD